MPTTPPPEQQTSQSPLQGVLDVLSIIRRRKGIILFGIIVGAALGTLAILKLPEKWESQAQIHIIRHDPNLATEGSENSSPNDFRRMEDELANQMKIMSSHKIVKAALEAGLKNEDGTPINMMNLPSIMEELADDQNPIDYVIDNLYLSLQGEEGNIAVNGGHWIYVTFEHTNEADTPRVLKAILAAYQEHITETYQNPVNEAAQVIGGVANKAREEWEGIREKYKTFMESSQIYTTTGDTVNVYLNSLNDYETQLRLLQFERYAAESRLEIIKESLEPENMERFTDYQRLALVDSKHVERLGLLLSVENLEISVATNAATSEAFQAQQYTRAETANTEFDKLLSARLDLKAKKTEYADNHPKVIEAEENLQDLEKFLVEKKDDVPPPSTEALTPIDTSDLIRAYVSLLEKDLEDLLRQETTLVTFRDMAEAKAKEVATFKLNEELLRDEKELKKELFTNSNRRLEDISLLEDYELLKVQSMGNIDDVKSAKVSILYGIIPGGFVGMMFGLLLAFVIDLADSTFRSPEQIRNTLNTAVLAHVPRLNVRRLTKLADKKSKLSPVLVTYHIPQSPEAEIFRSLRTNLYFGTHGQSPKVVQITSPNPKDGKSVTTANLAISLAQTGKSVLLIDCDMRLPMVDKLFGLSTTVGLSDVLRGEAEIQDAVQETEVKGLTALVCGPVPDNPAELLNQESFTSLLAVVREQYDYVIIDSPPLLVVSDATAIAPRVDSVILNLRFKKNGRPEATRAMEILQSVDADVLGVTMTGYDSQGGQYYSASKYTSFGAKESRSYYTSYTKTARKEKV
ncbi:Tyrosine-protein kinase YwqD [Polystyrenella longa]|uniref:non-specific protein-tyrosine kinase n=1 Tax=Polystyrenella longa TaxID=2528007 RepID=A0A518CQB8_9PLAN|nr:polysaccharide biosynthesis tyrosine autokinase [Polystyrenella longa]QDU81415.1 Tyrosine-protein kinase YwqD [Polystyrenella longa]